MSLNTLLFDLDGTLLPFDYEVFMKGYFKSLLPYIQNIVDPQQIADQIWRATYETVGNEDPNLTNMEAFQQAFEKHTGIKPEDIWPTFDAYYESGFPALEELTQPSPNARAICQEALDKGYRIVLATNPIFPELAIRHRMRWAGIDDLPWTLVTTMENSHFAKPNPKYFVEILDRVQAAPYECMMFGNDVQEDGVAGKLGMETYLVTDCLLDRELGHLEFTHEGTLANALEFVQKLPDIRK